MFNYKILERKRISILLESIFDTPLSIISAPMGYGKTTALQHFLENQKKIMTINLSFSSDEKDGAWIWKKICKAVESVSPILAQRLKEQGVPKDTIDVNQICKMIEPLIMYKTVLVIDDYEQIEKETFENLMMQFVTWQIKNLHIVLVTRRRPSPECVLLHLKNYCMIICQEDMGFTKDEIQELFKENGYILSKEEKNKVYELTLGWTAVVYACLVEYSRKGKLIELIEVTELIKKVVYMPLSGVQKEVLIQLSPLEKFSTDLAFYITQNKEITILLRSMLFNSIFIKYDRNSNTYIFHAILKVILREERLKKGWDEKDILIRSGDWHKKQGEFIEAIKYYSKANFNEGVFKVIEQYSATEFMNEAPNLIIEVFEKIDQEEKFRYPIAYLTYIYFYMLSVNLKKGLQLLKEVENFYKEKKFLPERYQILGEISLIKGLTKFYDLDEVNELCIEDYFRGETSRIFSTQTIITFGSPCLLALYHKKSGCLKKMMKIGIHQINYYSHLTNGCGIGCDYLIQAEYTFITGDLKKAMLFAQKALYKAQFHNQKSIMIDAAFIIMRIGCYEGDLNVVEENLKYLQHQKREEKNLPLIYCIEMIESYIYSLQARISEIPEWLQKWKAMQKTAYVPCVNMNYIVFGRILILKQDYVQLEVLAETMLERYMLKGYIWGKIEAYILDAIAKYYLYGGEKAMSPLQKALDLAVLDHIIMPFVEVAPYILKLIEKIKEKNSFIEDILEKSTSYVKRVTRYKRKINLTAREKEVMILFCEGYKQSEIAIRLCISVETVKKHIKNVYTKLNVHSKAEAIQKLKYPQKGNR